MFTVIVTFEVVFEKSCCLIVLPFVTTATPVVLVVVVVLTWLLVELLAYGVTAVDALVLNSLLDFFLEGVQAILLLLNGLNVGVTMKLGN